MIQLSRYTSWLSDDALPRMQEVIVQKEQGRVIVPTSNEQRQQLLNEGKPAIIFVTDGISIVTLVL
ncbi:hypothetical protein D3C77_740150 [compost metagenome]